MTIQSLPTAPVDLRALVRNGRWPKPTAGLASGRVQTNLVILPYDQAFDFLLFCQRNPKPCPLIEVLEPGQVEAVHSAPNSDIRVDLPMYRVYRHGELVDEIEDIRSIWEDHLVTFLLGCSFSFESALLSAGIPIRHIDEGKNVPMYITNIPTVSAGQFSGPLVVSMRPVAQEKVVRSVQVTSRFPSVHGAPIHIGNPEAIGIRNIDKPDYGEMVDIRSGEEPVFWACGVTPQAVAAKSKPPFMITHAPGHMFITDILDEDQAVL